MGLGVMDSEQSQVVIYRYLNSLQEVSTPASCPRVPPPPVAPNTQTFILMLQYVYVHTYITIIKHIGRATSHRQSYEL